MRTIAALVLTAAFGTGAASANDLAAPQQPSPRTVLVELFTSQGSSSCPAADEFVGKLATPELQQHAVFLTWHVDYWDRLGWRDPFASKGYTAR